MSENRIETLREELKSLYDVHEKGLKEGMQAYGAGWGLHKLTDAQHATWFQMQLDASPPEPLQMPDGTVDVMSPWLMAMALAEGGMDEIKRYRKTRMKAMENGANGNEGV